MGEARRIETSVIVVGGGPVGLALAATLGQAGTPCVLLERTREPSTIPRGQNLTARSLEHFYFWGCVDEMRAARLLPPDFPIGGITAYESLAGRYWYAPVGREAVSEFYYERQDKRRCSTATPRSGAPSSSRPGRRSPRASRATAPFCPATARSVTAASLSARGTT
jgi:choline dehydrogenase-like flavoprotein